MIVKVVRLVRGQGHRGQKKFQGQDTIPVSRSPGQGQGHNRGWRFRPIFRIFANSSYSSDRIGLGIHRNEVNDLTQKHNRRNFEVLLSRSDIQGQMSNL